ncbi:hypothetical protein [Nonomuraea zeae]|uniref:LPXTG cell wall anchor domain-containing protein n=1 Tax=Nonomuraea zeae TaxID=1642303 RepID=A0A5S4G9A6_9ACTN|nr:hypothetical protein [Nonomuraea zeae]TMR29596.1 hypothetical protein ETD85_31805 [Nonomuraea zeae]
MARARHLAAAGAMAAFVAAGVSMAAGLGTASAAAAADPGAVPAVTEPGAVGPAEVSGCWLPLPLLCEEPADDSWSGDQAPDDSWSNAPAPADSWSSAPQPGDSWPATPAPQETGPPWRPAGEDEHKVPRGHPETGGGGLAQDGAMWPFALGGAALLTGAGLTGFAVHRRKSTL